MDLSKYSRAMQHRLVEAQREAKARGHQAIEPEHVLWAMTQDAETRNAMGAIQGARVDGLERQVDMALKRIPKISGAKTYLSPRLLKVAAHAEVSISGLGHPEVLWGHWANAVLELGAEAGSSNRLLKEAGLIQSELLQHLKRGASRSIQKQNSKEKSDSVLDEMATDLTQHARKGKLDKVIGRDDIMRRIIQVLGRRRKNNPVLIGKPGVGKNTIIQGLAQRIAKGDVPSVLANKRIMSLEMGSLIAGASLRGQFEERMKKILDELKASAGEIILFIDEVHTLVGAGGDGASDASNLLKPALARGEIQILGATTPDEYRNSIEKDKALERRFQSILVDEPDFDESIRIMRGIKERFEVFHGVPVTDDALVASIQLSTRYISGRSLPDKAIDLVDEAASRLRIEIDSIPNELDDAQRELVNAQTELKALDGESGSDVAERREKLEAQSNELEESVERLREQWEKEVALVQSMRSLKTALNQQRDALSEAERLGDIDEASRLKYGVIKELETDLAQANTSWAEIGETRLLREAVEAGDIAEVVATVTGVPVAQMLESEREKLLQMETRIGKRLIGQKLAVGAIAQAIRRSRAGLNDPKRPVGSFFFLGPTGVGKTELAKAVTEFLFDDEKALVRLDMSEFMEKQSAIRLIGAPPGYKDSDAGGQLTEAVRLRPYSVVLFDEVEKAHPDVFNILLQVLDDGRLTDSKGNLVSFKNTVIIMTSNVGSHFLLESSLDDGVIEDEAKEQAMEAMRGHFRPEFLGRIDEIVMFHGLTRENIGDIAELHFRKLDKLLAAQKLKLAFDDDAREFVVDAGYEPAYGARPLRRAIQRMLQDPLSTALLEGGFEAGQTIRVTLKSTKEGSKTLDFIPEG